MKGPQGQLLVLRVVVVICVFLGHCLCTNDFVCSQHTNCVSCVRELGHESDSSERNSCVWCSGGIYDGTCRTSCDMVTDINPKTGAPYIVPQPHLRQIDVQEQCPSRNCVHHTNCVDCVNDASLNTDCQWCTTSDQCGDFYMLPYACKDERAFRIGDTEGSGQCPRTGPRVIAEMFFGFLGLLVLLCCLPCFMCRWCMHPWIRGIDTYFYPWKRILLRSDDFGQGAVFDDVETIRRIMDIANKGGAGRFEVDDDDDDM